MNVSHNALYRHYKSKNDLLFDLLKNELNRLTRQFIKIRELNSRDAVWKFKEYTYIYLEFAIAHPNIYKIMYSFEKINNNFPQDLIDAYKNNYSQILAVTKECIHECKFKKVSVYSFANTIWAFTHGLASMLVDNILAKEKNLDSLPVLLQIKQSKSVSKTRDILKFSIENLFNSFFSRNRKS